MHKKIYARILFVFIGILFFTGTSTLSSPVLVRGVKHVNAASVNDAFDPNANSTVRAIAVQSDGKALVGGDFTEIGGSSRSYLARLNADGSADTTFVSNANGSINTIKIQPDGRIIVGGVFTAIGGQSRNRIARLNSDGSVDLTFNPNANNEVNTVAIQSDGKILAGGWFSSIGGQPRSRLARLNMDGTTDISFDPSANNVINSILLQPDGKILAGGWFTTIGGAARSYLARLNSNGSVDGTFTVSINNIVNSIAIEPYGNIVIGGWFSAVGGYERSYIARLTSSGAVDAAFDPSPNGPVNSIARQPDGKIIVGGQFAAMGLQSRGMIARLLIDGTVDPGFDPGANNIVNAIAVRTDNTIVVGGNFSMIGNQQRNKIANLIPDGSLDIIFDPGADNPVFSVALQPDGKIVVGGDFTTLGGQGRNRLARLNADGSLDNSFNPNANASVSALAIQPDGKTVVAGAFSTIGGLARNRIARLNSNGSVDTGFIANVAGGSVSSIILQPDGKIIVAGGFSSIAGAARNRIARLNADGTIDPSFDPNADSFVFCAAVQPDGKIIVAGGFTTIAGAARNRIARLNADGTIDPSFDPNSNGNFYSLYIQPDGKIIVAGAFMSIGGIPRNRIARLNTDGTVDDTFSPSANSTIQCITTQADGKILLAGDFTSINGVSRNFIARINTDGSLDTSFDPNANNVVYSLITQTDGRIIAGGYFTTLGTTARSRIARLSADTAALQNLTLSEDGKTITWNRGQSSPEVYDVVFEHSSSLSDWILIGNGERFAGGWHISDVSLPYNQYHYIRARGKLFGGAQNASSSVIDSVIVYYLRDTDMPIVSAGDDVVTNAQFTQTGFAADLTSGLQSVVWSQVSGPGNLVFGTPGSVETTIQADADGSYVVRLTATDRAGNISLSYMNLIWDTAAPIVSAGGNVITNTAFTQNGSAADNGSGLASVTWSQVSGPGTVNFNPSNDLATLISADTQGIYVLRLTAVDNLGHAASSDMVLSWDLTAPVVTIDEPLNGFMTTNNVISVAWRVDGVIQTGQTTAVLSEGQNIITRSFTDEAGNQGVASVTVFLDTTAPKVNAGNNRITNSQVVQIGSATDLSGIASYEWTQISGPGIITFSSSSTPSTSISASAEGIYTLRLTATDNLGNSAHSDLGFVWDTTGPTVSAGPNNITNSPFRQFGSASDTYGIASLQWNVISGPGWIDLSSPYDEQTMVSAIVDGLYTLRLTAMDFAGNSASSDTTILWDTTAPAVTIDLPVSGLMTNEIMLPVVWRVDGVIQSDQTTEMLSEGVNIITRTFSDEAGNLGSSSVVVMLDSIAPQVSAGIDRMVNSEVLHIGSASDLNGIFDQKWEQVSGPGTVIFGSPTAAITTLAADVDGIYGLRFTATDNAGNTSSSDISFIWDTTNPVVNAGADKSSIKQFIQVGSASDLNGLQKVRWTKLSGPGIITFGSRDTVITTVSADTDGVYTLRLTATDNAGNTSIDDMNLRWDSNAPVTGRRLSRMPNSLGWHKADLSVTLKAVDPNGGTGVKRIYYKVGSGGSYKVYKEPITITAEGKRTVFYYSVDNAGNKETPTKSSLIQLDRSNPIIPTVYISPSSPEKGKSASAYFSVGDKYSPKVFVIVQITTTNGTVIKSLALGAKTKGVLHSKSMIMPTAPGTYIYKLISKDYAGNILIKDTYFTVK